jgi:hypothetical protein
LLPAGATGTGSAAGAGTFIAAGSGRVLISYLGGTGAHQFFHLDLAAMRALHLRVGPEDQLLKVLVTAMAMELKNGHLTSPLQIIWKKGQVSEPRPLFINIFII